MIETGRAALAATDWRALRHAYGWADDTPLHLQALLGTDEASIKAAFFHLSGAVMHQGTPWTATGPTALTLAGFILNGDIAPDSRHVTDILAHLVEVAEAARDADAFSDQLPTMADFDLEPFNTRSDPAETDKADVEADDGIYENEAALNAMYAVALLGVLAAAPVVFAAFIACVDSEIPATRARAAQGISICSMIGASAHMRADACARVADCADAERDPDMRASFVRSLGNMGGDVLRFLSDSAAGVRLCAALAPGCAGDPVADAVLIGALSTRPSTIDTLFVTRPPHFIGHVRFQTITCVLERIDNFDRLLPAALAILEITKASLADYDWGRFLAAAFKAGDGVVRNQAQQQYLEALVAREDLWDKRVSAGHKWFTAAGLPPYDRAACAALVAEAANRFTQ
jgi:hypothetical protein